LKGWLPQNSGTFRELGLSVGLQAVEKLQELIEQKSGPLRNKDSLHSLLKILCRYAGLKEIIEEFWLERTNKEAGNWIAHRDINMVMLATSLAPDGYLTL
jgi:hypothetical protein